MPGWIVQEDGPPLEICTDRSLNRAPAARCEDATRVEALVLRGPVAAEVRLRWSAICPDPAVQAASDTIVVQESAGGDDFRLDGKVACALHLAEIRRPAGTHQCLQSALPPGAHDLNLEITAAGSTAGVVGRATRCQGTRVLPLQNWQHPSRRAKGSDRGPAVVDHQEAVGTDTSRLLGPVGATRGRPAKSMCGTLGEGPFPTQIPAWNVQGRLYVDLAFVFPDLGEGHVLGVADQPGGFVIERRRSVFQGPDPQCHGQASALRTEVTTRGNCGIGYRLGFSGHSHAFPRREKAASAQTNRPSLPRHSLVLSLFLFPPQCLYSYS